MVKAVKKKAVKKKLTDAQIVKKVFSLLGNDEAFDYDKVVEMVMEDFIKNGDRNPRMIAKAIKDDANNDEGDECCY